MRAVFSMGYRYAQRGGDQHPPRLQEARNIVSVLPNLLAIYGLFLADCGDREEAG